MAENVQITHTQEEPDDWTQEWLNWLKRNALSEKRGESDRKAPQPTSKN